MTVKETCPCGSVFEITDNRGSYINNGGMPTESGLIYVWQFELANWRLQPRFCIEAKAK